MRKVKFSQRFKQRPVKSGGKRRERMKVHRKRLVAAGWAQADVDKLDAKALRTALKTIK